MSLSLWWNIYLFLYYIQRNSLLHPNGENSIRNTPLDAIFVGLFVKFGDEIQLAQSSFDGAYSYFASDGFTYGSTSSSWKSIGMLFVSKFVLWVGYVHVHRYDAVDFSEILSVSSQRNLDAASISKPCFLSTKSQFSLFHLNLLYPIFFFSSD